MLLHYRRGHYPAYERADEQGMPQPCALGQPWVNPDTQRTLAKLHIPRTDPWGRPLPGPQEATVADDPEAGISRHPPTDPTPPDPTRKLR
jgi:hypothetical protein